MAYMSVIRCISRELGLHVGHFTNFECERAERSILGGIGPSARQSLPLPLDELASLSQAGELRAPNSPVEPQGRVGATQSHSLLTVLKAGDARKGSSDPARPFHAVVRQQDRVVALAAKLHIPSALMSLFPSEWCAVCTKAAMVATVEATASPNRRSFRQPTLWWTQVASPWRPSPGSCWRS